MTENYETAMKVRKLLAGGSLARWRSATLRAAAVDPKRSLALRLAARWIYLARLSTGEVA
jgi:hypothetical protein